MSIECKLYIDDLEINVLEHNLGYIQKTDVTGRPQGKSEPKAFDFLVEAGRDITIVEWAMHATQMKKEVKIVLSSRFGMGKSTTVKLLDVYCTYCQYHFMANGSNPLSIRFSLSPATILVNDQVMLSRHWRVTDPMRLNQTPITRVDNSAKELTRYYLTNDEGEEIEEYVTGQIITLNIETLNRIGDTVTIFLNDAEHDFKPKGSDTVLENDTIRDYVIGSDIETIELEVIPEQQEPTNES